MKLTNVCVCVCVCTCMEPVANLMSEMTTGRVELVAGETPPQK